ncbi:MAG: hypothetical protein WCJ56_15895 [bacterium]
MEITILLWLVIGLISAFAALIAMVVLVVALVKRRNRAVIGAAITAASLLIISLISFTIFASKVATTTYTHVKTFVNNEQQALQRHEQQVVRLKAITPAALLEQAPPDFYTYQGFRDWWRIPLIYPYSLHAIDSLESSAYISRYKGGAIENPNVSEETLNYDITRYNFDGNWLIYQLDKGDGWGIFNFTDGTSQSFSSEEELFTRAKEIGYAGELHLHTIDEGFNLYFFPD